MTPTKTISTIKETTLMIANALSERKADDVMVLDLRNISTIADYFIIASGKSTTHIQALSRIVAETTVHHPLDMLKSPIRKPANFDSGWILLDYRSVIIHLFEPEKRRYYDLERLWGDARQIFDVRKNYVRK